MKVVVQNVGESLADPKRYENLFPGYGDALKAESYLKELVKIPVPASTRFECNDKRSLKEEMKEAMESGQISQELMYKQFLFRICQFLVLTF